MEVDSIPPPAQEKQVESADLVVGILADFEPAGVVSLCDGLRNLAGSPRILVVQNDPAGNAAAAKAPAENTSLSLVPWSSLGSSFSEASMQSVPAACEAVFAAGERLGAKASCVVSSKMESVTPQWICELLQPLLEENVDLVIPYYAPSKLEGLLNNSILYPLTRCLYGKRIHNPLGPDVGVSSRLAQKMLGPHGNARGGANRIHPLASLVPMAACDNLQICQVYVGARVYPPTNWTNLGSIISQVLGPIFLDMERTAPCWQRVRGSAAVPARGEHISVSPEAATLDLNRMVETFQLGVRGLQEIWGLVLPPATLFELRKLSRLAPEQVHMPDDLWARIVYDFALAHRLRTVNLDHLLGSMTPLYLAWVASYARELEAAGAAADVEQRIERLSLAFEAAKPYLVSRWRWPDRFNP